MKFIILLVLASIFGCIKPTIRHFETPLVPKETKPIIKITPTINSVTPTILTIEPSTSPPTEIPTLAVIPVSPEPDNTITDLARRIRRWKYYIDHNIWYECGVKYTPDEIKTAALAWATALIDAYNTVTYTVHGKTIKVPLKEAVGIIMSESRFDSCAIGPRPREMGYKLNILVKVPGTISHTKEDLQKLYTHPKFRSYKADIGPGQIVKRIGDGYMGWDEIKTYINLETGVMHVFTELAARGKTYQTKNPSSRWPGSADHRWYTTKILGFSAYLWDDDLYVRKPRHK